MIKLYSNTEIDFEKWDKCIRESSNGEVFVLSSFLNNVFPKWQALIYGDYEVVMPLFVARKMYFFYSFKMPFFVKELSIYPFDEEKLSVFINEFKLILNKCWFVTINISSKIYFDTNLKISQHIYQKLNLEVEVNFPEKELRKNIKTCQQYNPTITTSNDIDLYISFLNKNLPFVLDKKVENILRKVIKTFLVNKMGFIYQLFIENELAAVQFCILMDSKLYLIQNASIKEKSKLKIMPFLLYSIIENFRQNNSLKLVHFMGSDIKSVADFNSKFSTTSIVYNRLLKA